MGARSLEMVEGSTDMTREIGCLCGAEEPASPLLRIRRESRGEFEGARRRPVSPPVARSARGFGQGRGRLFIRRLCRSCQMPSTSVGDRGAGERSRQRCVCGAPVGKWRAIYGGRANNRVAERDVCFRNAEESGRLGVAERSCIDAELAACSDERLERCVLIQRREQEGAPRR